MGSIAKARSRIWNVPSEAMRRVPFSALLVGSFFFVGLSPLSSGTIASAVAAALYYAIPLLQNNWILLILCMSLFLAGMVASDIIVLQTGEHDPGIVVIDEVLGQWVALLSLSYHGDFVFLCLAFVLFRIFDILKVFPASFFEKREGGTSIMLDDLVAGIYANIAAHLLTYAYYHFA